MTDSGDTNAGLQSGGFVEARPSGVVAPTSANPSLFSWLPWSAYLGVSWTWCIGMFLPALLWRDFGVWSFAVFALPNVFGAAAMGWVMKSPQASSVFIERHRIACVVFSGITICFQTFFAAWVARVMSLSTDGGGWVWHMGWVACIGASMVGGIGGTPNARRRAGVAAAVGWAISLATLVWVVVNQPGDGIAIEDILEWQRGDRPLDELFPLAMVCLLGFGLCPYLDLTFHRARIESAGESRPAFGVGFGLVFALMIVGTLLTALVLLMLTGGGKGSARTLLVVLLALHTLPQLIYTSFMHSAETRPGVERGSVIGGAVVGALLALVLLGGSTMLRAVSADEVVRAPEAIYRCLMGFYGLAFPAYIAVVVWPVGGGGRCISKRNLLILAAVILAAAWFYWTGFVERRTWWVAGGVGVVVGGAMLACALNRSAPASHGSRSTPDA